MKKLFFLFILLITTFSLGFSQEYQDVVYLKNGSIIKGIIIEQIPNKQLKIKTSDGNIFTYDYNEIEKLKKIFKEKDNPDTIRIEKIGLGGRKYYKNDVKLNYRDLKIVVFNNQKAYLWAEKAKRNHTWSYISAFFAGYCFSYAIINSSDYGGTRSEFVVGILSTTVSIVLIKRANNYAKNGIDIYNTGLKSTSYYKYKFNPDLRLGFTNNGVGLVMKF